jgi:histidine triad (HIT) family protein
MGETIFTKIINREIPADIVYEDEDLIAILDINPVNKGHVLVIPKKHYTWIDEVPDDLLSSLFIVSKKLIKALKKAFSPYYVQLMVAGIDVPHVHIHLFPRYTGDNREHWNKSAYEDAGEKKETAQKIIDALE